MITIEQIKEYTKCPQFGDKDYGKWGALQLEQRKAYRYLIDIIERMEQKIEKLEKENTVLKTQIVNKDKYTYGIRMGSVNNEEKK